MPELTQFDNGKSIIRYLPAKGTAGFARFTVSTPSREPSPPARITARIFMVHLSLREFQIHLSYEEERHLQKPTFCRPRDIFLPNSPRRNPGPCLPVGAWPSGNGPDITLRLSAGHH